MHADLASGSLLDVRISDDFDLDIVFLDLGHRIVRRLDRIFLVGGFRRDSGRRNGRRGTIALIAEQRVIETIAQSWRRKGADFRIELLENLLARRQDAGAVDRAGRPALGKAALERGFYVIGRSAERSNERSATPAGVPATWFCGLPI